MYWLLSLIYYIKNQTALSYFLPSNAIIGVVSRLSVYTSGAIRGSSGHRSQTRPPALRQPHGSRSAEGRAGRSPLLRRENTSRNLPYPLSHPKVSILWSLRRPPACRSSRMHQDNTQDNRRAVHRQGASRRCSKVVFAIVLSLIPGAFFPAAYSQNDSFLQ